jgi:hypothetical protein
VVAIVGSVPVVKRDQIAAGRLLAEPTRDEGREVPDA